MAKGETKTGCFEPKDTHAPAQPGLRRRLAAGIFLSVATEVAAKAHQRLLTGQSAPLRSHVLDLTAAALEGINQEIRNIARRNS